MTKKEQLRFCNELIHNIAVEIRGKVKNFPEEWDGIELREYIAEKFSLASFTIKEKHNRSRLRAYRNEVLVRGLL